MHAQRRQPALEIVGHIATQLRQQERDPLVKLRDTGSPEVAFRVAVKDGKVNLTARALKGVKE